MTRTPKNRDELSKDPHWQTLVHLDGVTPEDYPDRAETSPVGKPHRQPSTTKNPR